MAGSIERYAMIIRRAVEVQQLRSEVRAKLVEMGELLTAKEVTMRKFDSESVAGAMKIVCVDGIEVRAADHVGTILAYKGTEIYLHEKVDRLGSGAMERVLSEISSADIVNALRQ